MAKEILHQLEIAQDSRLLSAQEMWLCNNLKKQSLALSSLLRTIDRLRSRIYWLKEGDTNTCLLHLHARHRKRKNFIAKLESDGQVVTSHEGKANVLLDFYDHLIGPREQREQMIDLEALGVQQHDLHMLDRPISEEEVWSTIKQLPTDKAPSPDGFTVWSRDFRNFWLLNSAFITLIPKEATSQASDFRPISLIHSFAKLIMKILANRLASRLDGMLSSNQSACIKGRFIQDNLMLVQQTAKSLHTQKQPRIMVKLDIMKAFDSVSWTFLMEVLERLGFGSVKGVKPSDSWT
jgi:hypothetical protein